MNRAQLIAQIREKETCLIVGLDPDLDRFPTGLSPEPASIFEFNRQIIDATAPYCVGYKPNIAFYEQYGPAGMEAWHQTAHYLREKYPNHLRLADVKRGDIGHTASAYARSVFEIDDFHAATVAPYMGRDSVEPFLAHADRWTVLLALTSNPSADDFEQLPVGKDQLPLFQQVIRTSQQWKGSERLMYVVGATRAEELQSVRKWVPSAFLLIPGIGAQGGDLDAVFKFGANNDVGLLINSSRGIIYARGDSNFAQGAMEEARAMSERMRPYIR